MNSTSRGGSAATTSSSTASPATNSESTVTGADDVKMEGDNLGEIEAGHGSGDDGDGYDFETLDLPLGFIPHLPTSSEPPSLQNKPRRLVWVVCDTRLGWGT